MPSHSDHSGDSHAQGGGAIPGMRNQSAYVLHQRKPARVPILIAVPHAGRNYPSQLTERMRNAPVASLRLEDRLADLLGEAVAGETGADLLVARAPRAMIDLNRATDDVDWDMVAGGPPGGLARHAAGRRARSGLGLVPRRLPGMGELWRQRMSATDLAQRIDQIHAPYHRQLGESLEYLRDRWGTALLIDLHSMPPLGPKNGRHPAPDFVIGDRFGASCEPGFVEAALQQLEKAGHGVAHNRPYAGGYVLDRHGAPQRGLNAMQVEVCRQTYLDDHLQQPGHGFDCIVEALSGLVLRLADELIARASSFPIAAE